MTVYHKWEVGFGDPPVSQSSLQGLTEELVLFMMMMMMMMRITCGAGGLERFSKRRVLLRLIVFLT